MEKFRMQAFEREPDMPAGVEREQAEDGEG